MTEPRPTTPRVVPPDEVIERMRGRVGGGQSVRPVMLGATLWFNKPVRKGIQDFAAIFFDPEQLDARLRELIVLRMAWDTRAEYEWGQHVLAARQAGISEADIRLCTRPLDEGAWTDLERIALRMTDDIHADDSVSDEVWGELSAMVDHQRAIAMVGVAACYRMVAIVLNSLAIQPEDDLPRWPA